MYQAPEVEHLEKAVKHIKLALIPEKAKEPKPEPEPNYLEPNSEEVAEEEH